MLRRENTNTAADVMSVAEEDSDAGKSPTGRQDDDDGCYGDDDASWLATATYRK